MVELFIKDLENVYENVKTYKEKKYIDEFKKRWDITDSIGEFYENISI